MDFQEMIKAIIAKVRYLVRDNDVARKIAESKEGIRVLLESNENGKFEVDYIKFIGFGGELYVYQQGMLFVTDDDVFGTMLFEYKDLNELLKLQN